MTTADLISRTKNGERDAYTAAVRCAQRRVVRHCMRLTKGQPEAEEMAHDAFVEGYLRLGQLRDGEKFAAWVCSIATNLLRQALRREGHTETVEANDLHPCPPEAEGLLAPAAIAMARVSEAHRKIAALRYVEGLSYEEIATVLAVPVGTVMSRLSRARAALRKAAGDAPEGGSEMTMDDIAEDVAAEVAVLMELRQRDESATERLSVLLARSPDYLQRVLEGPAGKDPGAYRMGALIRHLGRPAVEMLVTYALNYRCPVRERAEAALVVLGDMRGAASAACGPRGPGGRTGCAEMPAYYVADAVLRTATSEARKAALLAAMTAAARDAEARGLWTGVLLSMPEAAFAALMGLFEATDRDEGEAPAALAALGRSGRPFAAALTAWLSSPGATRQRRGAKGLEALARCVASAHGEYAWESVRTALIWAPLPEGERCSDELQRAAEAAMPLLHGDDAETRDAVAHALGLLRHAPAAEAVVALTRHGCASTRRVALQALADMGAAEASAACREALRHADVSTRSAAARTAGQLGDEAVVPELVALSRDADEEASEAALNALGDVGGEEALAALREAMTGKDKKAARVAATVLCTSPHFGPQPRQREDSGGKGRNLRQELVGSCAPRPYFSLSLALAELDGDREYGDRELTRLIAQAVIDYSGVRRGLIDSGLMTRTSGVYRLTDEGRVVWRVERRIREAVESRN